MVKKNVITDRNPPTFGVDVDFGYLDYFIHITPHSSFLRKCSEDNLEGVPLTFVNEVLSIVKKTICANRRLGIENIIKTINPHLNIVYRNNKFLQAEYDIWRYAYEEVGKSISEKEWSKLSDLCKQEAYFPSKEYNNGIGISIQNPKFKSAKSYIHGSSFEKSVEAIKKTGLGKDYFESGTLDGKPHLELRIIYFKDEILKKFPKPKMAFNEICAGMF